MNLRASSTKKSREPRIQWIQELKLSWAPVDLEVSVPSRSRAPSPSGPELLWVQEIHETPFSCPCIYWPTTVEIIG